MLTQFFNISYKIFIKKVWLFFLIIFITLKNLLSINTDLWQKNVINMAIFYSVKKHFRYKK